MFFVVSGFKYSLVDEGNEDGLERNKMIKEKVEDWRKGEFFFLKMEKKR